MPARASGDRPAPRAASARRASAWAPREPRPAVAPTSSRGAPPQTPSVCAAPASHVRLLTPRTVSLVLLGPLNAAAGFAVTPAATRPIRSVAASEVEVET